MLNPFAGDIPKFVDSVQEIPSWICGLMESGARKISKRAKETSVVLFHPCGLM